MGKSDPYVFNFYNKCIPQNSLGDVAFLGYPNHNSFSKNLNFKSCDFYDIKLKNWNINSYPYRFKKKYDMFIVTRVAYFCKNPEKMLSNIKKHLNKGGMILIDWGVGDHWRFKEFSVGWKSNALHEWAYKEDNFLHSAYLSNEMVDSKEFQMFQDHCKKFNYTSIKKAIFEECPSIVTRESFLKNKFSILKEEYLFLWPVSPQLYTCLLVKLEE